MSEPGRLPEGHSVDAVDWLPSGARSGLVRVRGHRTPESGAPTPLPELVVEGGGEIRRFASLPDPRSDRDPTAWRGAYVLDARLATEAGRLWLEWPGGHRAALPPLAVPEHQVAGAPDPEPAGGEVVDRAVLAERRARRAEASEQAQARIAKEALKAVESLELRVAEVEQRAQAAEAERDALRAQGGSAAALDGRVGSLRAEVHELRARLAEREAELERGPAAPAIAVGEAERRAERLRTALTATVATIADLRLRLHEIHVERRTRDVAAAADAVRASALERERADLQAQLDAARQQLRGAMQARDEAAVELEGVRSAHAQLRSQHASVSAELGTARARIAELEGEVAAVRAVAERSAQEARDAARAEAAALAAEQAHDAQEELVALRRRVEAAEGAIAEAETARELAEARALAADAARRAAEVAHAARPAPSWSPEASPVMPEATSADAPAAPRVPESLLAAAAQAEREAAERGRTEESERVVADLEAAAAALRGAAPEPVATPVEADRTFPIVSAPSEPPGDLARGRASRELPPLRGALVKLAHDDPAAAGRIIAGLLKAQHVLVDSPPDYDLTIEEVGTFAVSPAGATTIVTPVDAPRGRGQAAFHLRTDALTLAETLTGADVRPRRRRGPVRASGRVRAARRLTGAIRTDVALADLVRAGAELEPALVLRGFAYAVPAAWTQGQRWVAEIRVQDRVLTLEAHPAGGLSAREGGPERTPDARLRLTEQQFRDLVAGDAPDPAVEGDEQVLQRLLSLAGRARSATP